MDYGSYAPTYATARWAVPWVLAPLAERVGATVAGARILEIGCGTKAAAAQNGERAGPAAAEPARPRGGPPGRAT